MRLIPLFMALLCLQSCEERQNTSQGKEHTLNLVTSADNPPFEFHRTESDNREITGFDIDLAQALATLLNANLEIKDMDFNSLIPALQAGRAEFAMAALAVTDERKKNVDFSDPYYETKIALITSAGRSFPKDSDLKDKKIGVQLGSTHEQVLKDIQKKYPTLEMTSLNRLGELVQELRAGRINAVLTEESVAKAYVGSHKDIDYNLLQGYQGAFAIALPKDSIWLEKINAALKTLESNGTLEKLKEKWFPGS